MAYRVDVSPTALADAEVAYFWMQEHVPGKADEWFNGLQDAVLSLSEMPGRCPLAPESAKLGQPVHQLLYGKGRSVYRILFSVVGDNLVRVHLIRHGARDKVRSEDLQGEL